MKPMVINGESGPAFHGLRRGFYSLSASQQFRRGGNKTREWLVRQTPLLRNPFLINMPHRRRARTDGTIRPEKPFDSASIATSLLAL